MGILLQRKSQHYGRCDSDQGKFHVYGNKTYWGFSQCHFFAPQVKAAQKYMFCPPGEPSPCWQVWSHIQGSFSTFKVSCLCGCVCASSLILTLNIRHTWQHAGTTSGALRTLPIWTNFHQKDSPYTIWSQKFKMVQLLQDEFLLPLKDVKDLFIRWDFKGGNNG